MASRATLLIRVLAVRLCPCCVKSMPKMKTHKGAAKRFKKTGTGKIMRRKANARHLLTGKSPARKRRLVKGVVVDHTNHPALSVMLPY